MENSQFIIYQTDDGQTQIDVRMENDMIWLTRQQIAALFGRDYKTISKHINNVLKEKLAGSMVVAKFANTTQHGAIEGKTQTHSQRGGKGRHAALSRHQEPLVQRRKQTHSRHVVSVVPQQQWHTVSSGWFKTIGRQHARRADLDDCREPPRRKGRDGESGGESDKQ